MESACIYKREVQHQIKQWVWGKMFSEDANETDVREDFAMPLLRALNYVRGSENDIQRELTLKYERDFLGRKKASDTKLGRADYVLSVLGAGRWVLEIKAPNRQIERDDVEQAITYARHPEVSATYVAVTNGRKFLVYYHTKKADEDPIISIEVETPEQTARQLESLLSPAAIRRDCSPPRVDLNQPLLEGYRSTARITGGLIRHATSQWTCNVPLSSDQTAQFNGLFGKFKGFQSAVSGGSIWRDESSRIIARMGWRMPHEFMDAFMKEKKLDEFEYVSLSSRISTNREAPTVFDFVGSCSVESGEPVFDQFNWQTTYSSMPMNISYRGQALGSFSEKRFSGTFQAHYDVKIPTIPVVGGFLLVFITDGIFHIDVDSA
jgi:Type I restriction enzyme R protein N terminus (HSDR_N)